MIEIVGVKGILDMLVKDFSKILPTYVANLGYSQPVKYPSLTIEFAGQSIRRNRKRWRTTEKKESITVRYKIDEITYTFHLYALIPEIKAKLLDQIVGYIVNNSRKLDKNGEVIELSINPFEFLEEGDKEGLKKYGTSLTAKGISVMDIHYPKIPVNWRIQ